jgi:hypothetical protein
VRVLKKTFKKRKFNSLRGRGNWESLLSIVARLQAGRSGVRIPTGARAFSILQII